MSLFGPQPLRIVAIIDENTPEICRIENERLISPEECLAGLPIPHEVANGEPPCRCYVECCLVEVYVRSLETES